MVSILPRNLKSWFFLLARDLGNDGSRIFPFPWGFCLVCAQMSSGDGGGIKFVLNTKCLWCYTRVLENYILLTCHNHILCLIFLGDLEDQVNLHVACTGQLFVKAIWIYWLLFLQTEDP